MDTESLSLKLLGTTVEKRDHWHRTLRDPVFIPVYNYANMDDARQHSMKKIRKVFGERLMSVREFNTNPHNIFTSHEYMGLIDCAAAIKHTV